MAPKNMEQNDKKMQKIKIRKYRDIGLKWKMTGILYMVSSILHHSGHHVVCIGVTIVVHKVVL